MQKAAPVRKPYFLFHSDSVVTCLANHVTRTVLLSRRSPSSEVSFKESSRLQEPLLSHREQVMWSSLVLWLSLASLGTAVICPDGQSCEAGTRCCHLPGGGYGCCPLSPDVLDALPMVQPGSLKDFSGKFCPNKATCPLEYSCITTPVGLYGCCPWEEAVSCDDGRHCCPQDFLCSADGRSCLRRPVFGLVNAIVCPDGESECPNESTCCEMPDHSWGCCPMPQATCCEDKVHCCPHSSTCDVAHGSCNSPDGEKPMWTKFAARKRASWEDELWENNPENNTPARVLCGDGSSCPDGTTCCKISDKKYGCCPIVDAVCCDDSEHCCPPETECDLSHNKCISETGSSPMLIKTLAQEPHFAKAWPQKEIVRDVKCDDTASCQDGQTCCRLASGEWGCCPLAKAVCCSDHIHCCPSGTTCDTEHEACNTNSESFPWVKKVRAKETSQNIDVQCDSTTYCNQGETCCRTASERWACCPLSQALCCSDHIHCCPNGYTCNLDEGTCVGGEDMVALFSKTPAYVKNIPGRSDIACDDTFSCPDDNTCCRTASGEWGCCPMPKAVCCSDHVHCCPNGYTCNVEQESCVQGGLSVPWFRKDAANVDGPPHSRLVPCDDTASCPDGNTCCKSESGTWACCPLAGAVCCSDHVHCCPHGYTCDVEQGSCIQGNNSIPFLTKIRAHIKEMPHSSIVPCDETFSCPNGNTCCRTASGEWGCCPTEKAVCCTDHVHCCPNGYSCSVEQEVCLRAGYSVPWFTKIPAQVKDTLQDREVRCDDTSSCPDGNTCCRVPSGEWGCCPILKAVCCDDHEHCCPSGYTCDTTQGSCTKGDRSISWLTKRIAPNREVLRSEAVPCDDSHVCAEDSTCCRTTVGTWSCCHLPQAVCCSDHVHCCPYGYTCNVADGTCTEGNKSVRWHSKSVASLKEEAVVACDESTSCPKDSTCCRSDLNEWACCPLLEAVCCVDGRHCCPYGYKCVGDSCEQEKALRWDNKSSRNREMNIL
ncbi:progranulin isoform X19 [Pleurodeles waltl]|uniref:progranulin isoform X19 n=1 Tax=Pleurodeles waltl TaxID=8319 RepID=UPI0037095CD5